MATPIRELVIKVDVDADTSGFDKLDDAQEDSKEGSIALGVALGNLAADLVNVGVEALKTGAAMAVDLVFGTAEAADEIGKAAGKIGVASDALQRLRGAAELSGAEVSALDAGLVDLQKGIAEGVEKGSGPAVEALATLGLELEEVESFLAEGDIEGALGLIGDAANDLGDPVLEGAALLKLLGGGGKDLRLLLEAGTEGIRDMGDAISATGSVIDDEALGQFAAMQDSSLLLDKQIEGVTNQIAGAMAPAVGDIAAATQAWVADNQELISQDLPAFLSEAGTALVDVAGAGFEWIDTLGELKRDTLDFIEIGAELAGEFKDDVQPAIDGATEAFELLHTPITLVADAAGTVASAIGDMVLEFADAIGVADELNAALKTLRETFGEDEEITDVRGGAVFLGGGAALVNPADAAAAEASGDTTKLKKIAASDQFSASDRAKAASQAELIDTREAGKADKAAAAARAGRQRGIDASRARSAAARKRFARATGAGGGSGGGAAPAAAEAPSVDDLIATAIGGATGQPSQVASGNALAGTMLVNVDQSVTITNGPITVDIGIDALPAGASIQDLGDEFESRVNGIVDMRNKVVNDQLVARLSVGGG